MNMRRRRFLKGLILLPVAHAASAQSAAALGLKRGSSQPILSTANAIDPATLHRKAFVMDGHIHMMSRQLLQGLDMGERYADGHVDLPRAKAGGLDAFFFSVYTPEPYYPGRHEIKNTLRVIELALDQIDSNRDVIELARTASEITQINRRGKMAAFLDLEGPFDLDGDLHVLRALYRLGLRSMQLTAHNQTNSFIDACYDKPVWGGINEHGKAVIAEMNRLGMVINVAHASDEAILQSVAASRDPVIYSHGGFRGIVNDLRCITDEGAKAIADKGGIIGIQFGASFNDPRFAEWWSKYPYKPVHRQAEGSEKDATLSIEQVDKQIASELPYVFRPDIPDAYKFRVDQLARSIDYGVKLVGEDHVALGSDFDGGPPLPTEIRDVSDYPYITKALADLGYTERRIRKILGLNWLRVIRDVTEQG